MANSSSPLFFLLCLLCLPFLSFSQNQTALNNPRLEKAYTALQALKHSITSDPKHFTANWCGPDVCSYKGVYCAPAPDEPCHQTVAGLDLNHASLAGTLPEELGLLSDLALFHLNSNKFNGCVPNSFSNFKLVHELDISNNKLSGPFPSQVLCLPNLKYLDIRYNKFKGQVPYEIFDRDFDAVFINNNKFKFTLPENIGNSKASVLVLANNKLKGCIPKSIMNMRHTLNELILLNANITSCIPPEIGNLDQLTVFDISFNNIEGTLPESIGNMKKLEQLDVAHNNLMGEIPESICELPNLKNFTFSYNYFCGEPGRCLDIKRIDDRENCIAGRPDQRPHDECMAFLHRPPVYCDSDGCIAPSPPSYPPPSPPPYGY
jgi:Leucine rich repeat/Leucine rich repeat N-terminal domain